MLPPAASPIHRLVSFWWTLPAPVSTTVTPHRMRLFLAATEEILLNQDQGRVYDPLADNRFKWAAQWLDLGDRCITTIDPAIRMAAEFIFSPPAITHARQHND